MGERVGREVAEGHKNGGLANAWVAVLPLTLRTLWVGRERERENGSDALNGLVSPRVRPSAAGGRLSLTEGGFLARLGFSGGKMWVTDNG